MASAEHLQPDNILAQETSGSKHEIWNLSATQLDRLFASRQISPVEVHRVISERIERLNPSLGAFLTVTNARAMDEARAAEDRMYRDERLGCLDGVPYSIKDVEPTAGVRTTYGSVFFRDHVPTNDSVVAERLRRSGAVLIGKTNTPHLGYKDMTDSLVGPPARNPWDLDRTAGGSSGGAAAAVAAGLGPIAQGGDGGGSIRIPAALCGVYGIKPTFGLVPRLPAIDAWDAIATVGPLSRTVHDAAMMLSVLAGPDDRDPWSSLPEQDMLGTRSDDLRGVRIGWSSDLGRATVDSEVVRVTSGAAARFQDLGAEVVEAEIDWPEIRWAFEVLYETGLGVRITQLLAERGAQPLEESLEALVARSRQWNAFDLRESAIIRTDFYRAVTATFEDYDLLITPTMPMTAWSVEPDCMDGPRGTSVTNILDRLPFTYPFNFTTMPAASLPCGFSSDRLPIGLQIVGPRNKDHLVLRASSAFETAQPWAHEWPPVAVPPQTTFDRTQPH